MQKWEYINSSVNELHTILCCIMLHPTDLKAPFGDGFGSPPGIALATDTPRLLAMFGWFQACIFLDIYLSWFLVCQRKAMGLLAVIEIVSVRSSLVTCILFPMSQNRGRKSILGKKYGGGTEPLTISWPDFVFFTNLPHHVIRSNSINMIRWNYDIFSHW